MLIGNGIQTYEKAVLLDCLGGCRSVPVRSSSVSGRCPDGLNFSHIGGYRWRATIKTHPFDIWKTL